MPPNLRIDLCGQTIGVWTPEARTGGRPGFSPSAAVQILLKKSNIHVYVYTNIAYVFIQLAASQ